MGRTFAVSDLHGMKKLYDAIKDFLQPDDTVYCLGDCGDRGPKPWETIVAVYNDPQFIYIMGNHEDMLTDAMEEVINNHPTHRTFSLLRSNGGERTIEEWQEIYNEDPYMGKSWYYNLCSLSIAEKYVNKNGDIIYLTHAGFTLPIEEAEDEDLIWDRGHFHFLDWDEEKYPNVYIVHGHTPWYLVKQAHVRDYEIEDWTPNAYVYDKGHKICIDNASFVSGQTVLLDLDTFEVIPFDINKGEE